MPTKKTPTLQTKKKLQALQRKVNANEQEVQHAIREKEARKKLTQVLSEEGRHYTSQWYCWTTF
ncbi:hypothetical protein CY34DRAFT_13205 [Suillus luteus UH-Slu-Lm8-n1]|uniref:Uncharacterized protein n=1 Tax=Suillus luteus UH-Slu-Lm8-n1 TaxID=930992 RepID=A0A0D0BCQ2_9AGAM|nr:hypothetical protein CY34DRAFT_13205 [Suillus luteus UH-Slu-Lm8-n1]